MNQPQRQYDAWDLDRDANRVLDSAIRQKQRHLAKKSTFPKTYSPVASTARLPDNPIKKQAADTVTMNLCVGRAQRKEVIHATGNAGRRGQKTPKWTAKSKVRC